MLHTSQLQLSDLAGPPSEKGTGASGKSLSANKKSNKDDTLAQLVLYMLIGFLAMFIVLLGSDRYAANMGKAKVTIIGGTTNLMTAKAGALADAMVKEAQAVWKQGPEGWRNDINSTLVVESKPYVVDGKNAILPMQRASAVVNCSSPRSLFSFLTSPDGFVVIDQRSRPADFHSKERVLKSYGYWKGKLTVERSVWPLGPLFSAREFVTLNVVDKLASVFSSKSVLYPVPASTTKGSNYLRAFSTFALSTAAGPAPGTCLVRLMSAGADTLPYNDLAHFLNAKLFYPGLVRRLNAALTKKDAAAKK